MKNFEIPLARKLFLKFERNCAIYIIFEIKGFYINIGMIIFYYLKCVNFIFFLNLRREMRCNFTVIIPKI